MIELSRFQILRPPQRVSEEEKEQIGLPLYGDQGLSSLAGRLITAESPEDYASAIGRYAERDGGVDLVTVTPPAAELLTLYRWLDYKARPIRAADLTTFLGKTPLTGTIDLADEWARIADNLILSVIDPELDLACEYDLQLLVRALYVYALCFELKEKAAAMTVASRATDALLAQLMTALVTVPAGVIRDRCARRCRSASVQVERPRRSTC